MNGDTMLGECGKQLLAFCEHPDNRLVVVNSVERLCDGLFTRVERAERASSKIDKTTIDYVLIDCGHEGLVRKLTFDADDQDDGCMGSDHHSLLLQLQWAYRPQRSKVPLREGVRAEHGMACGRRRRPHD
jgi:hypothetical protein